MTASFYLTLPDYSGNKAHTVRHMDAEQTRRRIKAARALAGLSVRELAERLDDPGYGERTLRKIESGERPVRQLELREIARVCGLPYEFFTGDFAQLAKTKDGDDLKRLEARVNDLYTKVEEGVAALENLSAAIAPVTDGLDDVRELRDLFVAANPKDDDAEESAPTPKRPAAKRRAKGS